MAISERRREMKRRQREKRLRLAGIESRVDVVAAAATAAEKRGDPETRED